MDRMMKKEGKKGFWTSLFASKPCTCSGTDIRMPQEEENEVRPAGRVDGNTEIKVLGPGCPKCRILFGRVEKVLRESGSEAVALKVDDVEELVRLHVFSTPVLLFDGRVVVKGRVPSEEELKKLFGL